MLAEVEAVEEPVEEEDTETVAVSQGEAEGSGELVAVVVAEEEAVEEEEVEALVEALEEAVVLGLAVSVLGESLCAETLKLHVLPPPQGASQRTPKKYALGALPCSAMALYVALKFPPERRFSAKAAWLPSVATLSRTLKKMSLALGAVVTV